MNWIAGISVNGMASTNPTSCAADFTVVGKPADTLVYNWYVFKFLSKCQPIL